MYKNSLMQLKDLNYEYSTDYSLRLREKAFKSMPNNEKFDKSNRYEMILFINSLQLLWNLNAIKDCQKIEFLIKDKMPDTIITQLEIADWLVLNWNNFDLSPLAKAG